LAGFQNAQDAYADNILHNFPSFDNAKAGNPFYEHGTARNAYCSLDAFFQRAKDGTLPQVSWIIGDQETSEHTPWQPRDGGWIQKKVVEAITKGKSFNDTALIISYDEGGGWYDRVTPFHSPPGTAGEWLEDPYTGQGQLFSGPGKSEQVETLI
jgi:phospholipase C